MEKDICLACDQTERPEPELAERKWRLLSRKRFFAVAAGALAAVGLRERKAEAYWQIGWCCYSRCMTCCTTYYYCAPKYQNEYGQVWCGTYKFDHARNCTVECCAGQTYAGCGC